MSTTPQTELAKQHPELDDPEGELVERTLLLDHLTQAAQHYQDAMFDVHTTAERLHAEDRGALEPLKQTREALEAGAEQAQLPLRVELIVERTAALRREIGQNAAAITRAQRDMARLFAALTQPDVQDG